MPENPERRGSERFEIQLDLVYQILGNHDAVKLSGVGRTINMSSTGVLFTTENPLTMGSRIQVAISWPAQLNARCGLRLVLRGDVVWFFEGKAAMKIQRYEFRTCKSDPQTPITV